MLHFITGINGECVSGECDCIRNGDGQCVASPPSKCSDNELNTCINGQICNTELNLCMCPENSAIVGEICVDTTPVGPGYKHFTGIVANLLSKFFVGCFTCAPDSFVLVYWSTWHRS